MHDKANQQLIENLYIEFAYFQGIDDVEVVCKFCESKNSELTYTVEVNVPGEQSCKFSATLIDRSSNKYLTENNKNTQQLYQHLQEIKQLKKTPDMLLAYGAKAAFSEHTPSLTQKEPSSKAVLK